MTTHTRNALNRSAKLRSLYKYVTNGIILRNKIRYIRVILMRTYTLPYHSGQPTSRERGSKNKIISTSVRK